MNREKQLKFCRICQHQKFDPRNGIICGITGTIATFEDECTTYSENPALKQEIQWQAQNTVVLKKASQGKRFANYLIDFVAFLAFSFTMGIVLAIVAPNFMARIAGEDNTLMDYLFGGTLMIVYYTFLEATTGKSIGKFVTKCKVVDENGNKPAFPTILIRTVCRFIPFDALSFLFYDNEGWHDRLSNTQVIED